MFRSCDHRKATLLAGIPRPQNPVQISFPTGVQMRARAQYSSGSSGPDAWNSSEVKHLPLDVFDTLAELFLIFAQASAVPTQLNQSRMCCLSKPGRVSNYAIKASDTRPITICSIWYRIWASTLCKKPDFRNWLRQVLRPEVAGLSHQDIYENLIEIFDNFHQHGYVLALDYTKAFDCINCRLSCEILTAHGWPPLLISLLSGIWGQQSRFVQWDHHTHFDVLNGSEVQPQGDPLGPLIMTLWVQSGIDSISSSSVFSPNSHFTKVYLDDRTATATTSQHVSKLYDCWKDWSQNVGLIENTAKAVVSAVGKARFDRVTAQFPAGMVQRSVKILGAVSCSGRRQIHEEEKRRVLAAKQSARLLGCCGFSLNTRLRYLRQFSLSKINYGWVVALPGLSPNLFGPLSGCRLGGFATALPGFALSFWVVIFILTSFGLRVCWVLCFAFVCRSLRALSGLCPRGRVLTPCVPGWNPKISLKSVLGFGSTRAPTCTLMFLVNLPLSPSAPWSALLLITVVKGGGPGCSKNGLALAVMSSSTSLLCLRSLSVVSLLKILALGCCRLLLLLLLP